MIDHSGSIRDANVAGGLDNWDILLNFVKTFIDDVPYGLTKTRVAAIIFR